MLRNLFDPLESKAKKLRHVSLLQGTKAYGAHLAPIPIPARERAPRHPHENFYWLQEDYLREKQTGKKWNFTILRPQIVMGEAIGGNLSLIPPLGVYAALLREEGSPLYFPGGDPSVFELVDADLLARSMEWAATTEAARNETFNITNGDVATWQDLWPVVADALGMKVGAAEAAIARIGDAQAPGGVGGNREKVQPRRARGPARIRRRVISFRGFLPRVPHRGQRHPGQQANAGEHHQGTAGGLPRLHRFRRHDA